MTDYKHTLNLPITTFPMKANLAQQEPLRLKSWESKHLYSSIQSISHPTSYVLHDGPPYANGHLHCGHALNKILKDIIVKSKRLSGVDAPFLPGWDCHGLPIELNVEKKKGKAGVKLSHKDFRQACRTYANSQIDIQREAFKRLGVLGEWDAPYVTMDFTYEANIIRSLALMVKNGHIEQGFKPVHWCVDCASALAEAEVDYEDKQSSAIDVAFYVLHSHDMMSRFNYSPLKEKPIIVPIWTTTPWTLPANEAVCLHPMIEYALIETPDNFFVIADPLTDIVMQRYGLVYEKHKTILGHELSGGLLKHPFFDKTVPIIHGSHVTVDTGTGAVHTAPSHGPDDYIVGKQHQLPLDNPVLPNGCFRSTLPLFADCHVFKANQPIIDTLKANQTLLFETTIQHSYPHCWRHKTPVIFRATPQWFLSMDKNNLRHQLIEAIDKVTFIPEWGYARIRDMILSRPDWCISRQRSWGTPIPFFIHKETNELHPNTLSILEEVANIIEKEGIDGWFDRDATALIGDDANEYIKLTDTLDVWFDSGVSHFAVLKQRCHLTEPADIYLEGSDQHRGWFNSSLTTAVAMGFSAPYKTLLTHGYTVDSKGYKLSKSRGNYIELDKVIEKYGADILRLWVASTDYRNEVPLSDDILARVSDSYRRIRNTARFLLSNLFDFNPETDLIPMTETVELDKWIVNRTAQLQDEIKDAYESYQFHFVYQKIHQFCTLELGSFYLDIIKDRQYTLPKESKARRACQSAIYHVLQAMIRWMSPILSYTAEEIWLTLYPSEKSIFLQNWYEACDIDLGIDLSKWSQLQVIRDEVNKALEIKRQEGLVNANLSATVTIFADEPDRTLLLSLGEELRFLLITSYVTVLPLSACPSNVYRNDMLGLGIVIEPTLHEKCERCWHRREDVGTHDIHPHLCERCIGNIEDKTEIRQFV